MNRIPINTDKDGVARTITRDYGHSSKYHITMDRDGRFKMMGVIDIEDE